MNKSLSRRTLLSSVAIGAGGLLSGCDVLNKNETWRSVLQSAEGANLVAQRSVASRMALAREYSEAEMSPTFRGNGTRDPDTAEYNASREGGFADWNLEIIGLVDQPLKISLDVLKSMPQRTQITRHDCVEGWSAIGKWTGVPLELLLDQAGLKKSANYIVFRCADDFSGTPYYESIDLIDAYHPQTIMAHRLNDEELPIKNGAPLRLRVERQLGYKHAKYVHTIEVVQSLANIGEGKGGYWEDTNNYQWYGGI